MALLTGGLGGLGLLASKEIATSGVDTVMCISRSGRTYGDQFSAMLVDHIQEIANHVIIKGDTGDAAVVSDLMMRGTHAKHNEPCVQETPASWGYKEAEVRAEARVQTVDRLEQKLKSVDAFGLLCLLIEQVQKVIREGYQAELLLKMPKLLVFREKMVRGLAEARDRFNARPFSRDAEEYITNFETKLRELNDLIAQVDQEAQRQAQTKSHRRESAEEQDAAPRERQAAPCLPDAPSEDITSRWRDQSAPEVRVSEVLDVMGQTLASDEDISQRWREDSPPAADVPILEECRATRPFEETLQEGVQALQRQAAESAQRQEAATTRRQRIEAELKAEKQAAEAAKEEERRLAREREERELREAEERRHLEEEQERLRQEREEAERVAREEAERVAREEAERKERETAYCPNNHPMREFPVDKGYPCDVCDKDSEQGEMYFACKSPACYYTACLACKDVLLKKKNPRK